MATVPLSGTNIRLLSGVPFSNDYKHTRWFDTQTAQEDYFLGKTVVHSISQNTFQKIEGKNFIACNTNIDSLWGTNYIMFQNNSYNTKWFYAFVTKLEYKNPGTTYVHFEIDVLQTWMFSMTFKPSYVVREHCQLWNVDGSPVLNTVDEGLNYGSDYETINVMNWNPYNDVLFLVMVMKETAHLATSQEAKASVNALPQPLCYYIHPFHKDGTEVNIGLDEPENLGFSSVLEVVNALGKNDDTVNNVVSMYVTDYIGFDVPMIDNIMVFPSSNFMQAIISDGSTTTQFSTLYLKDVKSYIGKSSVFTNKYADYRPVNESKLLMYPYTVLILDDLKGTRQTIKNEYITGDDITVTVHGSVGTSNKTSYGIENYLIKDNLEPADWFYSSLENSLINNEANDLPIINDMLSAYLQGHRNSIQNQKNSIMFHGTMDGISGIINAVVGGATGAIGGSMLGPAGAIAGGIEGAVGGISQVVRGGGKTVLQLRGIQAKQKDISNTPPSLSKMGSNTYFDYGHNIYGLYLIKKQIRPEYQKKLEDFFQ
jgi:hypothetical protein